MTLDLPSCFRWRLSLGACSIYAHQFALRHRQEQGEDSTSSKRLTADVVLTACSMAEAGTLAPVSKRISASSLDRITLCVRVLMDPVVRNGPMGAILLGGSRKVFGSILEDKKAKEQAASDAEAEKISQQPDQLIHFRQLKTSRGLGNELDLDDDALLTRATGASEMMERKRRVVMLSGYGDPVYVEATVQLVENTILLDPILFINRTPSTITNCSLELGRRLLTSLLSELSPTFL